MNLNNFEPKKVLVVLISRDKPRPECYQSILDQHYTDYSLLLHASRPESFHPDPLKNKYLNCSHTRNRARVMVLASDAEYFLFVDDDVVLPTNAIADLASHKKDIVGGWYPIIGGNIFVGGLLERSDKFTNFTSVSSGLIKSDVIGLGCALISKEALQAISFRSGIYSIGDTLAGECFEFGQDAKSHGYDLYLDGSVVCEHLPS